jgi:multisubunit Na+/H+ antiporter MnhF subunit
VTFWLAAATALLLGLVPLGFVIVRRPLLEALVALELAGVLNTLVLLVMAEAFDRPAFMDLALVLALLALAGGLVFARMVERWV